MSSLSLTDLALGWLQIVFAWFIGLTRLYLLILHCPVSSCSFFLLFWYLAFLAIDWSRTVSASLPPFIVFSGCPLPLLFPPLLSVELCFRRFLLYVDLGCLLQILVFHPPSPTPLLALRVTPSSNVPKENPAK